MSPVELGVIILVSFFPVLAARPLLERWYVLSAGGIRQANHQFYLDFILFFAAGFFAAAINYWVNYFPVSSGLKLMVGMASLGFFMSLDLALQREQAVILAASTQDHFLAGINRPRTISRTFSLVAAITAFVIMAVIGIVISRNFTWLSDVGTDVLSLRMAGRGVIIEIFFVIAVFCGLVIKVIFSFAHNLNLMFKNQTDILERVSIGDLSRNVPVTSANEFGVLAVYINKMIEGLKHRRELIGALRMAEEVQKQLLPHRPPVIPGLDIAAFSKYSDQTGGDYYDFITEPSGKSLIAAVGDVSGHGIGPALIMASTRAFLRMSVDRDGDLAKAMDLINRRLSRDIVDTGHFVTMFLLEIDLKAKSLSWVRAGHDPALSYDPETDEFIDLSGPGLALGLDDRVQYRVEVARGWPAGSILVIGTDGIWEARNDAGGFYGKERLKAIVRQNAALPAKELERAVWADLHSYMGQSPQKDDITLVLIKLL